MCCCKSEMMDVGQLVAMLLASCLQKKNHAFIRAFDGIFRNLKVDQFIDLLCIKGDDFMATSMMNNTLINTASSALGGQLIKLDCCWWLILSPILGLLSIFPCWKNPVIHSASFISCYSSALKTTRFNKKSFSKDISRNLKFITHSQVAFNLLTS